MCHDFRGFHRVGCCRLGASCVALRLAFGIGRVEVVRDPSSCNRGLPPT